MWEAFLDFIFWIIQSLYNMVGDWGMAILIITIIFRAAITPLMYKQSKSTYKMQKIQPLVAQIKERFPDDMVRQNQETQKLYAEAKFNPLAGCVPMLIQMPIFIALFQVLRSMGERVSSATTYGFYNLVPNLTLTPSDVWDQGLGVAFPYLLLLIIFAAGTFIPSILQQKNQDPSQRNQMYIMMAVMSIMMIWIGWSSPAGVLLFWGASSILAIVQQQVSLRIIKNKEEAEASNDVTYTVPVEITVERKVKKKRPSKKR